jgi:SAM-dependent methyltransferase
MDGQHYRRRIYDRYASSFREVGREFNALAAKRWGKSYDYYFRNWLPQRKDAAILDLACGSGQLLYFFKQHGYTNLKGMDISPEQIKIAQQVVPDVVEGDAPDFLKGHPESFDLITGLDIIEHFFKDEVIELIGDCHAALKPGGHLILQTPNAGSPWVGTVRYADFTHELCFTPHLLTQLMAISGFAEAIVRETGPMPRGYSFAASARYLVWQMIRLGLKMYNIVETGNGGGNVYTRVFLIRGTKK